MQENMQVSPVMVVLKKAWPAINRILNAIFYLILTVFKSVLQTVKEQFKGGM